MNNIVNEYIPYHINDEDLIDEGENQEENQEANEADEEEYKNEIRKYDEESKTDMKRLMKMKNPNSKNT